METQQHPLSYKDFKWRWLAMAWDNAWGVFSKARGWNEAIRAVVTIAFAIFAAYGGVEATKNKGVFVSVLWWFTIIPFGTLVLSFFWNLPKAPHAIYLELENKRKKETGLITKELETAKAQIETDEKRDAKKKAIRNELGSLRRLLSERATKIRSEGYLKYIFDKPFRYNNTADEDTALILDRIKLCLETHYTNAEVELFFSMAEFKSSPIDPRLFSIPKYGTWRLMLDSVHYYESRLDKIMEWTLKQ